MNLDKKLTEIINKVSNRNSIPAAELEKALDHFFSEMRKQMISKNVPEVLIHNFGRFSPKSGIVKLMGEKMKDEQMLERGKIIEKAKHVRNEFNRNSKKRHGYNEQ